MQAIAAALPAVLGAFGNQKSSRGTTNRPVVESSLPVLAAADKKRLRALKKEADKERLYNLLTQPEVLGLLITLGGITASQNIPFSQDAGADAALKSTATMASVLIGLGYAGVGDLTTLLVAAGAGGGSLFGSLLGDINLGGIEGAGPSFLGGMIPGYNLLRQFL